MNIYKRFHARNGKFGMFGWGKVLSLCFLLATNLIVYISFLFAYSNPDKTVMIYINKLGEANFEFWFIGSMTILSIIVFFTMIKEEKARLYASD